MSRVLLILSDTTSDTLARASAAEIESALQRFRMPMMNLTLADGARYAWWLAGWSQLFDMFGACVIVVPVDEPGRWLEHALAGELGRTPAQRLFWVVGDSPAAERLRRRIAASPAELFGPPGHLSRSQQVLEFLNVAFYLSDTQSDEG